MEGYTCCKQSVFVNVNELENNSYTAREIPLLTPPKFHITFKFACKASTHNLLCRQDSPHPELLNVVDQPWKEASVDMTLRRFLYRSKARQALADVLLDLPIRGRGRRMLIDFAMNKARDLIRGMKPAHNAVYLHFRVVNVHRHMFHERDVISLVAQRAFEGQRVEMVPAAESAIEELESVVVLVEDSGGSCAVCLEEVCHGCEAMKMPCAHIFHGDCIKQWLRTSHYCPVCRYVMPTED